MIPSATRNLESSQIMQSKQTNILKGCRKCGRETNVSVIIVTFKRRQFADNTQSTYQNWQCLGLPTFTQMTAFSFWILKQLLCLTLYHLRHTYFLF